MVLQEFQLERTVQRIQHTLDLFRRFSLQSYRERWNQYPFARRVVPEHKKAPEHVGKYLHPDLFGKSNEEKIKYDQLQISD